MYNLRVKLGKNVRVGMSRENIRAIKNVHEGIYLAREGKFSPGYYKWLMDLIVKQNEAEHLLDIDLFGLYEAKAPVLSSVCLLALARDGAVFYDKITFLPEIRELFSCGCLDLAELKKLMNAKNRVLASAVVLVMAENGFKISMMEDTKICVKKQKQTAKTLNNAPLSSLGQSSNTNSPILRRWWQRFASFVSKLSRSKT